MVVKKASREKKTTNKKVNKGDSLGCEICVSQWLSKRWGVAVADETLLLCCCKSLKKKVNKTKSVKK